MRLIVRRSQEAKRGLMGGHKGVAFTLSYRLDLTEQERSLVDRYKLEGYALTWTNQQGTKIPDDTIGNMMLGRNQTVTDVTTLMANEEVIKEACDRLSLLLDVAQSFGGEEVFEFPRANSAVQQ